MFIHMHPRKLVAFLTLLLTLFLLAACGSSGIGTIPRGTPDTGNGTPAVLPSPSVPPQAVVTAPVSALGTAYAFVRKNQLWVALHGNQPEQVTHFDYRGTPDIFWHTPAWSPDDSSLAFIMNARTAGQGGGGCPAPDYGANGALYVLNTATGQLAQLVVPADSGNTVARSPHDGYWQYIFWEDPTHLLAWYNGISGKTSSTAGLYRYDLNSQTLTLILPLSSMGVATLFSAQPNMPLLISLRYSNEQLFSQVIVHPFGQQSQVVVYRHSVKNPALAASKVLTMGSEGWCLNQQSSPYVMPGWDISPDGEQLAAQVITSGDPNALLSGVSVLDLKDGMTTALFAQMPPTMLAHDLVLTWGPDSQTLVAVQPHMPGVAGPFSAALTNPAAMQTYTPNLAGQVTWRPDGSAFVLQNPGSAAATGGAGVTGPYMFNTGQAQGILLLTDVSSFVWG